MRTELIAHTSSLLLHYIKEIAVYELLGIALSCLNLSYDDFCRLTPVEFENVYKVYQDKREADYKDEWARMRMLAAIVIQPHLKRKVTPEKLLPFPWEKPARRKEEAQQLTATESLKRFEKLAEKVKT